MASDGPTITNAPDGMPVELTDERWGHILGGHPDLTPYRDAVLACISDPTIRRPAASLASGGTTSKTQAPAAG